MSISYNDVGNELKRLGKLNEALAIYRRSLALLEVLVSRDVDQTDWQYALFVTHAKIGETLLALGKRNEALASYHRSHVIIKMLVVRDASNADWLNDLGALAYDFVLAGDFAAALEAAEQTIAVAPGLIFVYGNRAHALMFLGRVDEARALYLKYRGTKNVQDDKSWETVTRRLLDRQIRGLMPDKLCCT